jgi:hypothetical protein
VSTGDRLTLASGSTCESASLVSGPLAVPRERPNRGAVAIHEATGAARRSTCLISAAAPFAGKGNCHRLTRRARRSGQALQSERKGRGTCRIATARGKNRFLRMKAYPEHGISNDVLPRTVGPLTQALPPLAEEPQARSTARTCTGSPGPGRARLTGRAARDGARNRLVDRPGSHRRRPRLASVRLGVESRRSQLRTTASCRAKANGRRLVDRRPRRMRPTSRGGRSRAAVELRVANALVAGRADVILDEPNRWPTACLC